MDRKQAELVADKLWRGITKMIRPGFTGIVIKILMDPGDQDPGDLSERDQLRIDRAVSKIRGRG